MKPPVIFAHRGASAICPENTMIAFETALKQGATGIETDVQLSLDGIPVLIHDESLERTTGVRGLVKDTTAAELERFDAGSWFDPSFSNARIPKLQQLLELTRSMDIVVNIELKNGVIPYPELERKVIELVLEYGMSDRVILSSFNHYSLLLCKQLAPNIRTGILYMEGLYRPWDYAAGVQADALHPYKYAVLPEWVAEAHTHGIVYHPFTVNDVSEMERLLDAGVAGIITDYPDRLAKLLAERGALA